MSPARLGLLLGAWAIAATAHAAAPNVTYLTPAGGQRGTTVEVTAAGTFDAWPVQVWVSGRGVTATAGKTRGTLSVAIAADAAPGRCWLRLHDGQGGGNLRPFLVGTLPEVAEKEPNDETKQAHKVEPAAAVVNGRLQKPGDVDCFAVALKKGQTLVASLEANGVLKSPMDGILQVISADGFVLEQNHDWDDLDPQIVYTVPKDGTYLVRVFAFPAMPDSSIRFSGAENYVYRLTLTTQGFADHALPLAVSRTEPGTVALAGWNLPADANKLSVKVPEILADSTLSLFHPQVANPVSIRLEPHPSFDATTAAMKEQKPLMPPFTLTGRVDRRGGVNLFAFNGKKGQPLQIQAEARALGLPLTPVLRVLDADGKQLARAEPARINSDVELSFTPPQDAVYRVEVRDLHEEGGVRHVYRLRVVRPEPAFELTVTADRFVVSPGKPLDIPVTIVRRNGFSQEVELQAEGLPAGVTATRSESKTPTLRLTTTKAGAAGSFRIVGRAKGQPDPRHARATLTDLGVTTTDLWITSRGN